MRETVSNDYEEISLRELIETLIKGWKLIAIITIISLLISGVFSYFIMDPIYEAKTILMASYATDKLASMQNNSNNVEGILDSISTYPIMTIQTYKEQINNPKILQQTIDEIKLDELNISRSALRKMINLETINDTNLIAVKVTYNNPETAAEIANTLANKFTDFITDMSKDQASKSSKFLKSQLEIEKQKLDEASLELKQFLSQPRGVDELTGELNSKLSMINTYKTEIVQKEVELSKLKAGLVSAQRELNNTPKILVTKKSVGNDPLLNQIVSDEKNISSSESAQIVMENEETNPNYIDLSSKISDYKISISELSNELELIKSKIDSNQKELESIQQELAGKNHEKTLIDRKLNISQNTYDAFQQKYEETRIAESTEVGDSSINIVSQAVIPEVPVGPRKMLNLAIAGVLGVMLGTFIVFFRSYWAASGVESKKTSTSN